jgi:hypothetical protein
VLLWLRSVTLGVTSGQQTAKKLFSSTFYRPCIFTFQTTFVSGHVFVKHHTPTFHCLLNSATDQYTHCLPMLLYLNVLRKVTMEHSSQCSCYHRMKPTEYFISLIVMIRQWVDTLLVVIKLFFFIFIPLLWWTHSSSKCRHVIKWWLYVVCILKLGDIKHSWGSGGWINDFILLWAVEVENIWY